MSYISREHAFPDEPYAVCPIHGYDADACPCNREAEDEQYQADFDKRIADGEFDHLMVVGFEALLHGEGE